MRSKLSKRIILIIVSLGLIGLLTVAYFYFMPHRNVVGMGSDFQMTSTALVDEYISNADQANDKYLNEEGESKIIEVTGTVFSVTKDMNEQNVVLLKSPNAKAGVSCTFIAETNNQAEALQIGDDVTVKGVIRSGAGYDADLDMYEDVILEKCNIENEK
ncbi:MAG: hypothetical protein ACI9JN_000855 [Bacteroidia bacterium]|jgi:hypothetical protein